VKSSAVQKTFRLVLSSALAGGLITGCAFSQWTEHYYFGDYLNKPVYENRKATGIAIMPFAMVGDLVTFPVQGILLIIKGDQFLYKKSSAVAREYITQRETLPADAWAGLSDPDRERVKLQAQSELERLGSSGATGTFAFAIGVGGKLDQVQLSSEQWEQLRRRVPPELVESGAALDPSCNASL
jgi:hypothetical protein